MSKRGIVQIVQDVIPAFIIFIHIAPPFPSSTFAGQSKHSERRNQSNAIKDNSESPTQVPIPKIMMGRIKEKLPQTKQKG